MSISVRSDCQLIAVGPLGWEKGETTARLLAGRGDIRYLGYVPEEDLPAVMAGATGFIYPSYYEGFGFPILEAFCCGAAVIASGTSSCAEIASDAALKIDPKGTAGMAQAMEQVLTDKTLKDSLKKAGLIRAREFSFERTAQETLKVYQGLCQS